MKAVNCELCREPIGERDRYTASLFLPRRRWHVACYDLAKADGRLSSPAEVAIEEDA